MAEKAGLSVVMDRCMGATHRELGLGPARSSGRASGRNSPVIERRVPRNETSPDRLARLAVTIALAASVALALGVLVLWAVPSLLTRHPSSGVTATDRLKAVNDVRAPLVAFLVALGAAGTLWFTGRTYILNREGHVTDRYTSAVGQLGDDSAYVRVGGIYALERIGNDSPKDRRTIIYVLGAFIRDRSKRERSGPGPPTEDVQAAIRVAGRLTARATDTQLDLRGADLRNADLASLPPEPEWVLLRGADTTGATGRIIDRIGRP